VTYSNPFTFAIAPDSDFKIRFVSNAAFVQRATITMSPTAIYVFSGSGEGVAMATSDGLLELKGASRQGLKVSVYFEFNADGTSFTAAQVVQVWQTSTLILVGTEDGNDNDNNDTVMTVEIRKL